MLLFANERLSRLPSCLHRPFCLLQLRLAEEILYEFGVEPTDVVLRNIMDSAAVGDERLVFNLATYQHMIRDLIIAAETKRLDNLAGHSEEEKEDESHAAVDTPNTDGDLRRRGNGGYR